MPATKKPEWNPNYKGRVLLWDEQGIGDKIVFASLIPELNNLVDQLIVKVDERLIPLFKRSFSQKIIYINNIWCNFSCYFNNPSLGLSRTTL